jgi:predicted lipoprotein with Yx(FWY)xxD motif
MPKLISLAAASLAFLLAAGCSTPPPPPSFDVTHPMPPAFFSNGLLVTPGGMTLYVYDQDPQGASACAGDCAQTWMPFAPATADTPFGDFTILARDDGSRQWAYKGKPIYIYQRDRVMGDTAGDKRDNAWHAVRAGM